MTFVTINSSYFDKDHRLKNKPSAKDYQMLIEGLASLNSSCENVFHRYGKCDVCQNVGFVSIFNLADGLNCNICADCWTEICSQRGIGNEQYKKENQI